MQAIAYQTPGPIDRPDALQDVTLDDPQAAGRDLLVRIAAVSVNPADTKIRQELPAEPGGWRVLGYDAAGVVEAVGPEVKDFKAGDRVYYAGSIARPGTNSELHLVDERIVGHAPASLDDAEAAALPLTALTAWEMLFDRLDVERATAQGADVILVVGGAGGVGSITVQLLRALTDLTVIATASRPETSDWVKELGAHHVINHREPMAPQVEALGLGSPGFVFSTNQTAHHLPDLAALIAPQGRLGVIDDPAFTVDPVLTQKCVALHFEWMFSRSMFQTPDMSEQGRILNEVARLVEAGAVRSTLTEVAGPLNAATLRDAHARIETGTARGKIVLKGFDR